jgi:carboxypeptidase C (cathepsin A)
MVQWAALFPEFQSNPVYVFGESYGAKFAIQLAKRIHDKNRGISSPNNRVIKIN